jgi:hypothetical protein
MVTLSLGGFAGDLFDCALAVPSTNDAATARTAMAMADENDFFIIKGRQNRNCASIDNDA